MCSSCFCVSVKGLPAPSRGAVFSVVVCENKKCSVGKHGRNNTHFLNTSDLDEHYIADEVDNS